MAERDSVDGFDLAAGVPKIEGVLRPKPKYADGISKRVVMVIGGLVVIGLLVFLVSLDNIDTKKKVPSAEEKKEPTKTAALDKNLGAPKDVLSAQTMDSGAAQPATLIKHAAPVDANVLPSTPIKGGVPALAGAGGAIPAGAGGIPEDPHAGKGPAQLTPEQQAAAQAKQAREARIMSARAGGLVAKQFDGGDATPGAGAAVPALDMLKDAMKGAGAMGALGGMSAGGVKSPPATEQDEKLEFLKSAQKEERGYHPHVALAALSPNEVKTGTYIPMVLEQGINSDLPGQITARVTEAVYDTMTGCRLLIPAMSKVVGRYDSKVALGQGRILAVWNSMIFPDGAELNLAGMQAYDMAGQSGLQSDVDNHYLRLIGLTFGMSMITAGVQLSVPAPNPGTGGTAAAPTPAQLVATSLAQQYGQLGAQILGKYMAVQPTLRNYPGERFMVMVPNTIVFSKIWRNRCGVR